MEKDWYKETSFSEIKKMARDGCKEKKGGNKEMSEMGNDGKERGEL